MKVTARRWQHGWELHVEGVGVTQVRTLAHARQQAADLVETMTGKAVDPETFEFVLGLESGLPERVEEARRRMREAEEALAKAAAESRAVARALREEEGLSVTDAAVVLGVSRGRISQLTS